MIDYYLLEELTAFAKFGTLAAAADYLGISQPAITRGTQKLEEQLGVKLFIRTPNRITLTKTGEYAVQKAQRLLDANQAFVEDVITFNHNMESVTIASTAPGPLFVLNQTRRDNLLIQQELIQTNKIAELLLNRKYTCIVTNQPLSNRRIHSSYLGQEHLSVRINSFSNLGGKQSVTFEALSGLSYIVRNDIGIWADLIHEKIPDAKFIYQSEADFTEIRNYSIFPYFETNLSSISSTWDPEISNDRVPVEISDNSATMNFFANYLIENQEIMLPLINLWQDEWKKFD
ncbi:TPA: LysR family transcriptional regulator [Enterococcus faecalis]|nr:LysR family transcriptional regulator [Enterococcus faecalis]HBI1678276.1 LysR family transcriptional regulator [Enterococcus faecalis]HBI1686312.1 LysR family transcriptional regulator [Enterococcus faecalis]HBI1798068.1 LysR family transcriptional regulator [Enterococcus faecalis]HBI1808587.1 LysR family transcriptional regulator [Enterococcus faecalis]